MKKLALYFLALSSMFSLLSCDRFGNRGNSWILPELANEMAEFLLRTPIQAINTIDRLEYDIFDDDFSQVITYGGTTILISREPSADSCWNVVTQTADERKTFISCITMLPSLELGLENWLCEGECYYEEDEIYSAVLETSGCLCTWDYKESVPGLSYQQAIVVNGECRFETLYKGSETLDTGVLTLKDQRMDQRPFYGNLSLYGIKK